MTDPSTGLTPEAIDNLVRDTSPYLSCDECFAQLDEYAERRTAEPDHRDLPMEVHLAACGACADEAAALMELLADDPR